MTRGGSTLPWATPCSSPIPWAAIACSSSTSTLVCGPEASSRARSAKTRGVNRLAGSLESSRAMFEQPASSPPRSTAARVRDSASWRKNSSTAVSGADPLSSLLNRVSRKAPIRMPSTAACAISEGSPGARHTKTTRRTRRSRAAMPAAPATVLARVVSYRSRAPAPTSSTRRVRHVGSVTSVKNSSCVFPVISPEARARPREPPSASSSPRRSSGPSSLNTGAQIRSASSAASVPDVQRVVGSSVPGGIARLLEQRLS